MPKKEMLIQEEILLSHDLGTLTTTTPTAQVVRRMKQELETTERALQLDRETLENVVQRIALQQQTIQGLLERLSTFLKLIEDRYSRHYDA